LHVQGSIAAENIIILKENKEVENLNETIAALQLQVAALEKRLNEIQIALKK
jgi:ubiquinone biosynthesis protein UbiJ